MRAYIKVERDWHCFHCQIEDNVCNGTETPDACKFQGCKLGISLCRQVDVCARDTSVTILMIGGISLCRHGISLCRQVDVCALCLHCGAAAERDTSVTILMIGVCY